MDGQREGEDGEDEDPFRVEVSLLQHTVYRAGRLHRSYGPTAWQGRETTCGQKLGAQLIKEL